MIKEGLSILENAVKIGVPTPEFLKEKLLQINSGGKRTGEK